MKWKRYYSFWQSVILSAQTTPPPPHPIPTPTRILYSPDTHFSLTLSIFLRLSLHLSQPIASGMHFHKAVLHQDKSFQILYCWEPFHLFPDSCWTTKAFLSYLKNKTLSLSPPAVSPFTACFHKCQNLPHVSACFTWQKLYKNCLCTIKSFPFLWWCHFSWLAQIADYNLGYR